jgi:hypothetical protein
MVKQNYSLRNLLYQYYDGKTGKQMADSQYWENRIFLYFKPTYSSYGSEIM